MTAMSSLDAIRLVLRNDLAELERLAAWIEGWARQGASPDVSFAIQLCLEEAIANVIMYGAAKDDRLEISVQRPTCAGHSTDRSAVAPTALRRRRESEPRSDASVGEQCERRAERPCRCPREQIALRVLAAADRTAENLPCNLRSELWRRPRVQ